MPRLGYHYDTSLGKNTLGKFTKSIVLEGLVCELIKLLSLCNIKMIRFDSIILNL